MIMAVIGREKFKYFKKFRSCSLIGSNVEKVVNLFLNWIKPELSASHSMLLIAKLILSVGPEVTMSSLMKSASVIVIMALLSFLLVSRAATMLLGWLKSRCVHCLWRSKNMGVCWIPEMADVRARAEKE